MDSVLNSLVTDRLGPGEYVEKFIKVAKERLSFEFSVAVRSPMVALDLACISLGLMSGDAVGLSALSPAWAGKALLSRGLVPVWLDVDMASAGLSSLTVERLRSSPVKAVFLAQPWGIVIDPSILTEFGVPIIEDVTSAIGAKIGNVKAGAIGTLTILGLEYAGAITSGGGALLFATGRRESIALRNISETLVPEERMSDMNAALAVSQIKDLDKFLEKRRDLAELYAQSLVRSHRKYLSPSIECEPSHFGCVVVLESGIKDVRAYAKKKDVDTVLAFEDSCMMKGFVPEGMCPVAASLANRAVAFPLNQRIGKSAAQKIAKVLATLP
jgi:dTDP-4-amino-4,6-dideoxygalactose transaminase